VSRHSSGFRSPLGKLKGINLAIENMGPRDLQAYNFYDGKPISFEFESGITVSGMNVTGIRNLRGELMLIQFTNCTVTYKDEILFSPEMGDFDMAVGKEIVSAFAGAADYLSFPLKKHDLRSCVQEKIPSESKRELNEMYADVRQIRMLSSEKLDSEKLLHIFQKLKATYPMDWLLPIEIYELTRNNDVLKHLSELKITRPKVAHLIDGGLQLLNK